MLVELNYFYLVHKFAGEWGGGGCMFCVVELIVVDSCGVVLVGGQVVHFSENEERLSVFLPGHIISVR